MFRVPVIPPDLRPEETIIKAACSLDSLQQTITLIFNRIDERIEKNNVKLAAIDQRIRLASSKVKSLASARSSIRIYAPSRFPAAHVFQDSPVTFTSDSASTMTDGSRQIFSEQRSSILDNKNEILGTDDTIKNKEQTIFQDSADKLISRAMNNRAEIDKNISSVETNSWDLASQRRRADQAKGLGPMPCNLTSITSALLINTDQQIYAKDFTYTPMSSISSTNNSYEYSSQTSQNSKDDFWKPTKLFRNKRIALPPPPRLPSPPLLDPPPLSMTRRHRNQRSTLSGGLRYTPQHSEPPPMDLPMDLPNLPGIANDVRYDESQESVENKHQYISPSSAMMVANLPDLSELLSQLPAENLKDEHDGEQPKDHQQQKRDTTDIKQIPPPPPPPLHGKELTPNVVLPSLPPTPPPPPPPPPPPSINQNCTTALPEKYDKSAIINSPQLEKIPQNSRKSSLTPTNMSPLHSELMEAIRNAGGTVKASLKPVTKSLPDTQMHKSGPNNLLQKQNSANAKPSNQFGDLMADLHKKLQMRRIGISGGCKETDVLSSGTKYNSDGAVITGESVLSKLSALIPPPDKNISTKVSAKRKEKLSLTRNMSSEDDDENSNSTDTSADWMD